ncbi:hypothetical protein TRFO_26136 [Tritrichomonas foetus]|uniref:RING-type domain-containing protein n=1 Tax=Tritrichomonas foetus TaxID=1144522 RepID=A0A1J4K3H6_9EUKA|nr:hypothetical protein TRFO_26136 [Tritrichomonas foetus]|eukprot:OHT05927.1 hypothetical protein TRFO_26136 [Tritrichomonas foetus]
MKKHRCPVCMKRKENINVLIPCMHMVCFDCLSVWVGQSGNKCPYCRAPFTEAYSCDERGNIKNEINIDNFSFDISNYRPPKGATIWEQELSQNWSQVLQNVCKFLININMKDNTILSFIMKIITDNSKEDTKIKIEEFFGGICPNAFEIIFTINNPQNQQRNESLFSDDDPLSQFH